MISFQTNVSALEAQNNMRVNEDMQSKTIQQLTSGYRINSSGDDASGLAIANQFRSNIAELTQGVQNANQGLSQLQIIDGGLNNISQLLDRLKTLATESASSTFTGNRATLNQEYQQDVAEITRQATNINLNNGGSFNTVMNIYIGGAKTTGNAQVTVDLSGSGSAVDASSLGIANTNVLGGGVGISGNTTRLDAPGGTFVVGTAGTDDQTFTFQVYNNGTSQTVTAKVAASANGSTLSSVLSSLNGQLNQYGITAQTGNDGTLQFSGSTAFTVTDNGGSGTSLLSNDTNGTAANTSNYIINGQATYAAVAQTLSFETSAGAATVTLAGTDSLTGAIAKINQQTSPLGVYAVENAAGTGISFQSANSFSVNASAGSGVFAASGYNTAAAPTTPSNTNAAAAINAINTAVANLGLVQGKVGAGENKLNYAINLAQSQITNFSAAESQIRDADVATAAANLTKGQVLQQASVAALAQANSAPQSVLKLLQ
ncbi:MAG TPA: flagellin [Bryobacteraceae bacterium]|nr:flagellin [Bryobacteraceae bacterium]